MKIRKFMIILILTIFLFSIASVTAANTTDVMTSTDDAKMELSKTNEEVVSQKDNQRMNGETSADLLGAGEGTYADLSNEIGNGGNKNLTKSYYKYNGETNAITINTPGVINGNGAVIDMTGSNMRAFYVSTFNDVIINNLTIKNAYGNDGGAIYFSMSGTVTNCNFIGNTATDDGGAISMYSGTVSNCNFSGNTALGYGGAVYFSGNYDYSEVANCNFTCNTAKMGGAIRMSRGDVSNCNFTDNNAKGTNSGGGAVFFMNTGDVINCNFINNTASGYGGAIIFYSGGTATNCNFTNNKANGTYPWGGAIIFFNIGKITNCNFKGNNAESIGVVYFKDKGMVINCTFADNTAQYGGAVYFCQIGDVTNCNFTNNTASKKGGAVYFNSSTGDVINCNFSDNTATDDGGAVFFNQQGNVSNCNFAGNKVTDTFGCGGGIKMDSGTVSNCNFTNNHADWRGGAVYFLNNSTVLNCNFTNNQATGNTPWGGAVYFNGDGTVSNSNFINNHADDDGGAVYFNGDGTVSNSNFVGNTALDIGGAVYFWNNSTVLNCNFTDNKATGDYSYGGAIFSNNIGNVLNCNFTCNTAKMGGAIEISSGNVLNCNFTCNTAKMGGAIEISSGTVLNCNFANNNASQKGGAVYFEGIGDVINCTFTNNQASYDGGAIGMSSGTVTNCKFVSNYARNYGGAVYFWNPGDLIKCKFVDNSASYGGGAIYGYQFAYAIADSCIFKTESDKYVYTDILEPTLTVDDFTSIYGSGEKLTFELKTYSGILIDDGNITISVFDYKGWICDYTILSSEEWIVDLPAGFYYAYFDTEYEEFYSFRREITVIKASSVLEIPVNTISLDYGTSSNVKVTTQNATGIVAKINNENIEVSGNTVMIPVLSAGTYLLEVMTLTDSNHSSITKKALIFVNKIKTELTANSITANYNSNESLVITLKDIWAKPLFNQLVIVDFNGVKTFDFTDLNGTIKVPIKGWSANTYDVKIVFMENNNYKGSNATAMVTINNIIPLGVDDVSVFYGDAAEIIVVTSTVINNQNISITVNGTSKNATVEDGIAKAIFEGLTVNEYEIQVNYSGSQYNLPNSTTAKLTVNKANSTLDINDITVDYGKICSVTVNFTGALSINAFIINHPDVIVNVNNNTIIIPILDAGNYILTVTTIGDDNHINITKNVTLTVNKAKTQIIADSITTVYNIEKELLITLSDSNGNPLSNATITVDLNGDKTYTTDTSGQIKISTAGLVPKAYSAKIIFIGNKNYNESLKDIQITVKKATPKIKAKKKTYKTKNKNKKYTIILKDNIGKPIKNAKVSLIVKKITKSNKKGRSNKESKVGKKGGSNKESKTNKKKNFAITNNKGKATFKVLINKKGKYNAKVKFYGNECYNKVTKAVKLTIK